MAAHTQRSSDSSSHSGWGDSDDSSSHSDDSSEAHDDDVSDDEDMPRSEYTEYKQNIPLYTTRDAFVNPPPFGEGHVSPFPPIERSRLKQWVMRFFQIPVPSYRAAATAQPPAALWDIALTKIKAIIEAIGAYDATFFVDFDLENQEQVAIHDKHLYDENVNASKPRKQTLRLVHDNHYFHAIKELKRYIEARKICARIQEKTRERRGLPVHQWQRDPISAEERHALGSYYDHDYGTLPLSLSISSTQWAELKGYIEAYITNSNNPNGLTEPVDIDLAKEALLYANKRQQEAFEIEAQAFGDCIRAVEECVARGNSFYNSLYAIEAHAKPERDFPERAYTRPLPKLPTDLLRTIATQAAAQHRVNRDLKSWRKVPRLIGNGHDTDDVVNNDTRFQNLTYHELMPPQWRNTEYESPDEQQ